MDFRYATTITLFDTDASGLLFYGSLFRLTQACFEEYLEKRGLSINRWITGDLPALPVRKVDAEYLAPLRVGTRIEVAITDIAIGSSSLTVTFSVTNSESKVVCAKALITHVAIDRTDGKAIALPAEVTQRIAE